MLRLWTQALESQGVLVFQSGKFSLEEARGVSLYHSELPIVLLNGKDAPAGRIFTIFHEVFHLIRGRGGLCGLEEDVSEERLCNKFAAEVLMPIDAVKSEANSECGIDLVRHLSKIFKVSDFAMAIRLFQQNMIDQDVLNVARAGTKSSPASEEDKTSIIIPYHKIRLRDIGRRYASAVFNAYERDEITFAHTSRLIGAKVQHLPKMQESLISREELGI